MHIEEREISSFASWIRVRDIEEVPMAADSIVRYMHRQEVRLESVLYDWQEGPVPELGDPEADALSPGFESWV